MRYDVQYGQGTLALNVPVERVVGVLAPRSVSPLSDITSAVWASLAAPIASDPLTEIVGGAESALIITVDNTRPSPRALVEPIVELCHSHDVTVTVIIATGRHRLMTEPELRDHLGERILRSCRILRHDPFDEDRMVGRGVTSRGTAIRVNRAIFEHDLVIGCGIIEPSYLCGWSGGRKLLMPGLSHHASIDNNHYLLTQPGAVIGRLHGNPVSDDAFEFVQGLPYHFITYAICGPNDEFVEILSGDPLEAHEQACERCAPIYQADRLQADIVVSSPGGWPYDFDLVQGKKAVIPAIDAVKEDGVIILCAECRDGLGAESTFINWLRTKSPEQVVRDVRDREMFNLGAHGANILAKPIAQKRATVILVTCEAVARELKGTYLIAVTDLEEAWQIANGLKGEEASVLFIEKARRLIVASP